MINFRRYFVKNIATDFTPEVFLTEGGQNGLILLAARIAAAVIGSFVRRTA